MRKQLLLLLMIIVCVSARAQTLEISAQLNGGYFRYNGQGSTAQSYVNYTSNLQPYANNPYGSKFAFSEGAGFRINFALPSNIIYGIQAGYESLTSRVDVNTFYPPVPATPGPAITYTTNGGMVYYTSSFATFNPYFGYRVNLKKVSVDMMPGADLSIGLASHEKDKIVTSNSSSQEQTNTTRYTRDTPPNDIRIRLAMAVNYHRTSINLSYANGYTNYLSANTGSTAPVYSRLFRFGLGYRFY